MKKIFVTTQCLILGIITIFLPVFVMTPVSAQVGVNPTPQPSADRYGCYKTNTGTLFCLAYGKLGQITLKIPGTLQYGISFSESKDYPDILLSNGNRINGPIYTTFFDIYSKKESKYLQEFDIGNSPVSLAVNKRDNGEYFVEAIADRIYNGWRPSGKDKPDSELKRPPKTIREYTETESRWRPIANVLNYIMIETKSGQEFNVDLAADRSINDNFNNALFAQANPANAREIFLTKNYKQIYDEIFPNPNKYPSFYSFTLSSDEKHYLPPRLQLGNMEWALYKIIKQPPGSSYSTTQYYFALCSFTETDPAKRVILNGVRDFLRLRVSEDHREDATGYIPLVYKNIQEKISLQYQFVLPDEYGYSENDVGISDKYWGENHYTKLPDKGKTFLESWSSFIIRYLYDARTGDPRATQTQVSINTITEHEKMPSLYNKMGVTADLSIKDNGKEVGITDTVPLQTDINLSPEGYYTKWTSYKNCCEATLSSLDQGDATPTTLLIDPSGKIKAGITPEVIERPTNGSANSSTAPSGGVNATCQGKTSNNPLSLDRALCEVSLMWYKMLFGLMTAAVNFWDNITGFKGCI